MNREFMELFNRELALFYEHATEFSEEYPGVAERLGTFSRDNPDPMLGALLEGAAFLATRVQLKLKHEFPLFTEALLEQLVPNFLAPIPSVVQVQAVPEFGDSMFRDGVTLQRGAYLDAGYRERDRQVACRFRLTRKLTIWPLSLTRADYVASVAPLESLDLRLDPGAASGLRLGFRVRSVKDIAAEPDDAECDDKPDTWARGLDVSELTVHLTGPESEAAGVYEQIFGHTTQIALRWQDRDRRWRHIWLPVSEVLRQIGFDDDEMLYPVDHQVFRGFDVLRDYFTYPQKFLGFELFGLGKYLQQVDAPSFEVLFVFDEPAPRLAGYVDTDRFGLFCAAAINLFEKSCDRIYLKSNEHEYQVVPDRTRYLEYEPHRIVSVRAQVAGRSDGFAVYPLYSSPEDQTGFGEALFYAVRRLMRRRTAQENRFGLRSDYTGTDMFLQLTGLERSTDRGEEVTELSVRALCSNRHLPEHLPTGETGADFQLLDNDQIGVRALGAATAPREPILTQITDRGRTTFAGDSAWRLINMLSLNHLGLMDDRAGASAQALKDVLSLFGDLTDTVVDRRIRGLRSVSSKPITRRIRAQNGIGVARGIEVTVTLEDKAFEGSSAFLLGAILDRFFADYVTLNQFTQTVIRTVERREIARWPPRMGRRRPL